MLANLKDDNSPASARRSDQMVNAYFFAANTSLTASPGNCNSEKLNDLKDDRESCLHVLTWMALNSTNHTISGGSSCTFLRIFDEDYEDKSCVKGGDLKKDFLLCREIPCTVKFDGRPQHPWTC